MEQASPRHAQAIELFAPLGPTYDRYARLLSLGQDPRWRRFLVTRIEAGPGDTVLDVATGTGAVARELVRQKGCRVVGLDQSSEMLDEARRRVPPEVELPPVLEPVGRLVDGVAYVKFEAVSEPIECEIDDGRRVESKNLAEDQSANDSDAKRAPQFGADA